MKKLIALLFIIITLLSLTVNADDFFADGKNIYSDHVYMVNLDTGRVVYELDSEKLAYPASLTKIMTCILAIENIENLDETVTVPSGIFADIYADNAANMALKAGEEISVRDLISATMVRSACDSASVLAWYVSGSIEAFADLMNEKAIEIGAAKTHFVNAHGLHNDNHYTTAKDMFLIAEYALKNPVFCEIISQYSCTIPATNKSDERVFDSTISIEIPTNELYYEYVTGVKSGFTDQAGRCLVTKATKNGESYLLVTMGANRDRYYNENMAFTDALTLFEYHFAQYSLSNVITENEVLTTVDVEGGESDSVQLVAECSVETLVALDENPEKVLEINPDIKAPIKKGERLGQVTVEIDGKTFTSPLVAESSVDRAKSVGVLDKFGSNKLVIAFNLSALTLVIISVIIVIIFIKKIKDNRRNKKSN